MDYNTPIDELVHHGIKGQRWYHRRYQNEDGSLTTLGKIRYGRKGQRRPERMKEPDSEETRAKRISEMTDEEIVARINRLDLEAQLRKRLPPPTESKMEKAGKYVAQFAKDTVIPLATDVTKKLVQNAIEDAIAKDKEQRRLSRLNPIDKMIEAKERESKKLKALYEVAKYKKQLENIDADDEDEALTKKLSRAKTEYEIADYEKKKSKLNENDSDDLSKMLSKVKTEYEIADYENKKSKIGREDPGDSAKKRSELAKNLYEEAKYTYLAENKNFGDSSKYSKEEIEKLIKNTIGQVLNASKSGTPQKEIIEEALDMVEKKVEKAPESKPAPKPASASAPESKPASEPKPKSAPTPKPIPELGFNREQWRAIPADRLINKHKNESIDSASMRSLIDKYETTFDQLYTRTVSVPLDSWWWYYREKK